MDRNTITEEEILHRLEAESRRTNESVKQMLIEEGRQDLADDLTKRIRDIDSGVDGARRSWSALSAAQKRVLEAMGDCLPLVRSDAGSEQFMITMKNGMTFRACNIPTARNLCARDLIALDGTAFDPEKRFVITERGRFVLKYGCAP